MKRQKRDQTERAFSKGYKAGIEGRSRSLCPHDTGTARQQWLNGWRESRTDQWDGLNRMPQVQQLSNIQQISMNTYSCNLRSPTAPHGISGYTAMTAVITKRPLLAGCFLPDG